MLVKLYRTLIGVTGVICASATASNAGYIVPGETAGLAALSPLPEGIYVVNNYTYGGTNAGALGVEIPYFVWSTPWTFSNTRIEFIGVTPSANIEDPGFHRFGMISIAYGGILAHDFGGGFTGGVMALARSADPDPTIAAASGRTTASAVFGGGLYYTTDGYHLAATAIYSTSLGGAVTGVAGGGNNDTIGVDFSATKSFGKLELGFVGFTYADATNLQTSVGGTRNRETELGGLIGYDFGPVTAQAYVTRAVTTTYNGVKAPDETRGWLRLIVPLWQAPTQVAAAPLKARY